MAAAAVKYLLPPDVLASALEAVGDSVADAREFEGTSMVNCDLIRAREPILPWWSRLHTHRPLIRPVPLR